MNKQIITKPAEALWVADQYDYSNGVAFDTETRDTSYPERWAHGGSYEEGNPTGVSLYNGRDALYVDTCGWTDEQAQDFYDVLGLNLSEAPLIIGHNIVFDLGVLYKYGINLESVEWYDTMTAAHLIDEERKYKGGLGLKTLAELDLGVDRIMSWEDTRHDPEQFREYGVNDAVWTWQLAQKYSDELIIQDLDNLFREIEMPFHRVLLQMDVGGVGVDYAKASEIADRSQRVLLEYEVEMYDMLGVRCMVTQAEGGEWYIEFADEDYEPINFNSGMQVAEAMIGLGIELTEQTPTGNWSTSKDVLESIDHPFVEVLLKHKSLRHICSHFINKLTSLVDSDGRMRPNWKNTGTVTGRLSASKPNFQNLPNIYVDPVGVRECIVAPEGKMIVAIDFSAQETRVMAELSRDPALIRMIIEDQDPHLLNANAVFQLGIPEEKMVKTHPEYKAIKEKYDEERSNGKVFSFAVPYGAGTKHISETLGIELKEAERLMNNLREEFPLLFEAIDKAQADAQRNGYITSFTGRRRRYPKNKWGRVQGNLNAAFNFLIQGFSADMIRLASIDLYNHIKGHPEYDAQITMMVHDELTVELNEEYAEQFAEEAVDIFSKCYKFDTVPIEADAGIGKTYQEAK